MSASLRDRLQNTLLAVCSVLLVFTFAFVGDRVLGRLLPRAYEADPLLFPSHSHRELETDEFRFEVDVNSLGFRDREFAHKPRQRFRILAIGDSFTYGTGVNIEDTWVKRLELALQKDGIDVDVANLGFPGAFPTFYAAIAERAVDFLEADLVLVAVSQGDDLAQSFDRGRNRQYLSVRQAARGRGLKGDPEGEPFAQKIFHSLLPTIASSLEKSSYEGESTDLRTIRDQGRDRFLKRATDDQLDTLNKLDPEVYRALMEGGLNPALVRLAIEQPEYFVETFDLESPVTQEHISNMAREFERIRTVADSCGAQTLVLSVPNGNYVSKRSYDSRERIGFRLAEDMLTSTAADDSIRLAAEAARVPFAEVTEAFRRAALKEPLFYEFDGHFMPVGHRLFAESIKPHIARQISEASKR